jgi:hypothetical protein
MNKTQDVKIIIIETLITTHSKDHKIKIRIKIKILFDREVQWIEEEEVKEEEEIINKTLDSNHLSESEDKVLNSKIKM